MNTTPIEVDDPIDESDAEWMLEELGNALVNKLYGTLAAINGPLSEERDAKEAEAQTLRGAHADLQRRVEAQQRILAGEIDRATAEGRDAGAAAKREESADLERNLHGILAQAEAAEQRSRDIGGEMAANYRAVFQREYPAIRTAVVAAEIALAKMLNMLWQRILQFEAESGLQPFVRDKHKLDLSPMESGPEAPYFVSLRRWFQGRV